MKQNDKRCRCKEGAACAACVPIEFTSTPEFGAMVRNRIVDELEDLVLECKHLYYCLGKPLVDDATYDYYEDVLRKQRPDSPVLNMVGCPLCYNKEETNA